VLLLLLCVAALLLQVGAKLVPVQLQPPNWDIPRQQLEAAFNEKTKFILVNTPHNPTGKVRLAETTAAVDSCLTTGNLG
jgi:aspartate/methionine/tyrosine aminotransferase